MRMKDRMTRLEIQMEPAPVNQAQINESAAIVMERMDRLVESARGGDASMTLADRLAEMSVAQHVAWSVAFVPGFRMTQAVLDDFMEQHARARGLEQWA